MLNDLNEIKDFISNFKLGEVIDFEEFFDGINHLSEEKKNKIRKAFKEKFQNYNIFKTHMITNRMGPIEIMGDGRLKFYKDLDTRKLEYMFYNDSIIVKLNYDPYFVDFLKSVHPEWDDQMYELKKNQTYFSSPFIGYTIGMYDGEITPYIVTCFFQNASLINPISFEEFLKIKSIEDLKRKLKRQDGYLTVSYKNYRFVLKYNNSLNQFDIRFYQYD